MSEASPVDDRGRFTIDPKWRKMLGNKVIQIWTPRGLLLRPAHGLTSAQLKKLGSALTDDGEAEGMREAEERYRRVHERSG